MKKAIPYLLALLAVPAQAKILFDPSERKALFIYPSGNAVAASVCEEVTARDLQAAAPKAVESAPGAILLSKLGALAKKCARVSQRALSQEDVKNRLPAWKDATMRSLREAEKEMLEQAKKDGTQSAGIELEFAQRGAAIGSMTAEELYQVFLDGLQSAEVVKISFQGDLEEEIGIFSTLANLTN